MHKADLTKLTEPLQEVVEAIEKALPESLRTYIAVDEGGFAHLCIGEAFNPDSALDDLPVGSIPAFPAVI